MTTAQAIMLTLVAWGTGYLMGRVDEMVNRVKRQRGR